MDIPYVDIEDGSKIREKINVKPLMSTIPKKKVEEAKPFIIEESYTENKDRFVEKYLNIDIDKMSDKEIAIFIKNYLTLVLDMSYNDIRMTDPNILTNPRYILVMKLFNNCRFVNLLTNYISKSNLDFLNRVYINRIVYNYLVSDNNDTSMKPSVISLACAVNSFDVTRLMSVGFNNVYAATLASFANSSLNKEVAAIRTNHFMISTSNYKAFNEQSIIRVYEILFQNSLSCLYKGIMFDVYPKEIYNNMNEEQQNIYGETSLAILDILQVMPTELIETVLKAYVQDYIYRGNVQIRFKMLLSTDYYRVNQVIDKLETEGIMVP